MPRVIKKIVEKPEEIEKVRQQWLSMERVINAGLRSIDPRYEIRNLRRRKNGSIEFEAGIKFASRHSRRIEHLLALLEDEDLQFTQAKYYLPRELQKRLKKRALELGVPTSSLVTAILAENC